MSPKDLNELADEYVIGLLSDAEALDVERRAANEPEVADAITRAAERFLEVDLTEKPAALDEKAWDRITARLGTPMDDDADASRMPRAAAHTPVAANSDTASGVGTPWKQMAQWAIAASLVLAIGLGWTLTRSPATVRPQMVAVLLSDAGEPQALIDVFNDDHVKVVPLEEFSAPEGRTLQVWTLPDLPEATPVSLGLLEKVATLDLQGPALPQPAVGQLYEITIEQAGGSPTGLPTGPIVGKGFAKNVL